MRIPITGTARLIGVVLTLALVAGDRVAASPEDVIRIRKEHADGLIALARFASGEKLLNDAERCLLLARAWVSGSPEIDKAIERIEQRRTELAAPETIEAYRLFLRSAAYRDARREFENRFEGLRNETVDRLLVTARRGAADAKPEIVDAACEAVFSLDPGRPALTAIAGEERLQRLRSRDRQERSLTRLKLGDVVVGPKITRADLRNKVVLWRSFSL